MEKELAEPPAGRKRQIRRSKYGLVKRKTIKESRLFSSKRRAKTPAKKD